MKILSRKPIQTENLKDFDGENLKTAKRSLREPLLKAFDIYKSNVYYGIITETAEEKKQILKWYNSLLDLEESSLAEIPDKVKEYLR